MAGSKDSDAARSDRTKPGQRKANMRAERLETVNLTDTGSITLYELISQVSTDAKSAYLKALDAKGLANLAKRRTDDIGNKMGLMFVAHVLQWVVLAVLGFAVFALAGCTYVDVHARDVNISACLPIKTERGDVGPTLNGS